MDVTDPRSTEAPCPPRGRAGIVVELTASLAAEFADAGRIWGDAEDASILAAFNQGLKLRDDLSALLKTQLTNSASSGTHR